MRWPGFLLALLPFLAPCQVAAWSGPAHQAIAEAAQGQLTPTAQTALARILQDTDTLSPGILARGATWPDDLRARLWHHTIPDNWSSADVEEADQFNADHPSYAQWHFVDLPLEAGGYPTTEPPANDPLRPFVGAADIVHAIGRCIAILEAPTADPKFSKPQAVRWLVHLVGDLHQLLHVTSGYYKTTVASFANTPTRITDPVKAAGDGVLGDRGGNGLAFSANESNNLHSLWDRCLPGVVSGSTCSGGPNGFTALAAHLGSLMTPSAIAAAATRRDDAGSRSASGTRFLPDRRHSATRCGTSYDTLCRHLRRVICQVCGPRAPSSSAIWRGTSSIPLTPSASFATSSPARSTGLRRRTCA